MGITVNSEALAAWREEHPDADEAHLEDIHLAVACGLGDAAAVRAFEERYASTIASSVRRFGGDDFVSELTQLVRERLLLGADGTRPRIREYGGRGSLKKFVEAVALRTALNLLEQRQRHLNVDDDDALLDLPARDTDPELALVKARYRAEFKTAFAAALGLLEPDLRAALRQHYLDRLGLAELGKLYGWSVATASRRLASAREQLLKETRAQLAAQLKLSAQEIDSVLRLIESQLSVDGLR